jgi:hypothetical protein
VGVAYPRWQWFWAFSGEYFSPSSTVEPDWTRLLATEKHEEAQKRLGVFAAALCVFLRFLWLRMEEVKRLPSSASSHVSGCIA